jgi:hypothetical protein
MTQVATIATHTQLSQVPCMRGLHAEIEQPMVLFVLQDLRLEVENVSEVKSDFKVMALIHTFG